MNRSLIKELFGFGVFYSGYYHLVSILKRITEKKEVVVLMYHSIDNDSFDGTSQKNFKKQMEYLSKNYNAITLDKLLECYKDPERLPKKSVIITFDDGYKDNYSLAYPILRKYDLPATIFLTTGHINNNELFWWDKIGYIIKKTKIKKVTLNDIGTFLLTNKEKAISRIQEKLKRVDGSKRDDLINKLAQKLKVNVPKVKNMFLSWNDVREMSKNNISFGAHTVTHPILTRISLKEAKNEILDSRNKIEREINKKVKVFAYPNGTKEDMSDHIDNFLKENGFCFALSTVYGLNDLSSFRLKRIGVEPEDKLRLFRIKLLGIGKSIVPLYLKLLT